MAHTWKRGQRDTIIQEAGANARDMLINALRSAGLVTLEQTTPLTPAQQTKLHDDVFRIVRAGARDPVIRNFDFAPPAADAREDGV